MTYEESIRETDRMIREIMVREQITLYVLVGLAVILAGALLWLWLKQRKEAKLQKVVGGYEYRPEVTETVQVDQFGTEFHRMGIPQR